MSRVATLKLVEVGTTKILAGHDSESEAVLVFRRDAKRPELYHLHRIDVSESEQSLRSFLSVDQSEASELVNAVLATMSPPKRKRRPTK